MSHVTIRGLRRSAFLAAATLLAGLALAPAAPAAPLAPAWSLELKAEPTSFVTEGACDTAFSGEAPSFCQHYTLIATNVGGAPAALPKSNFFFLQVRTPAGLVISSASNAVQAWDVGTGEALLCPKFAPFRTSELVTCAYTKPPVQPRDSLVLRFAVGVEAGVPAQPGPATATLTSGTAPGGPPLATTQATTPVGAPRVFGLTSFPFDVYASDGSHESRAGGHPNLLSSGFDLTSAFSRDGDGSLHLAPAEDAKDALVYLPPGLVGDPTVLPTCPLASVEVNKGEACPRASRVGIVRIQTEEGMGFPLFSFEQGEGKPKTASYLYNVAPEHGYPAEFAFTFYNKLVTVHADLVQVGGSGGGYALRVGSPGIPAVRPYRVTGVKLSFFGDPGRENGGATASAAFLRNPTDCSAGPLSARIEADSWQDPGGWVGSESVVYPQLTGCDQLQFQPTFQFEPVVSQADTPSGYKVALRVPQAPKSTGALATPDLRDVTVSLPPGVVISPSAANGLAACQETGPQGINIGTDQIGPSGQDLGDPEATELGAGHPGGNSSPYDDGVYHAAPGHCPHASQIGDLEVKTPLLAEPLIGHVYVAAPECGAGPCTDADSVAGRLYGIYLEAVGSGVIVKLRGRVMADPETGQLTATFLENPQLPFEEFRLKFYGGEGAVLANPQACGRYTTQTELTPWSAPATSAAAPPSGFDITSGAGGSTCAASEAAEPNAPSFEAGTETPLAGSYSPFVLRLRRADGTQRFKGLNLTLPPGLTGKIAGVPYCPEAAIAAAAGRSGVAERQSPSCPSASQVGTVTVGAGPGPRPYYVTGRAYLAGPYKGAPLSLAIITPAVAGPFDLGTVVVRTALYVDPETARITARSDEIPHILAGTPLDVRSIAVSLDRSDFTLNPTSCEVMQVGGEAITLVGQVVQLHNRFQVGGCKGLDFKPRLKVRLKGATKRIGHPALRAVLTAKPGEANIGRAQVNLPHGEFLDQGNLNKTCTKPVLLAGNCPASSVYGHAKAWTLLLGEPLQGPVYLVGGYGYKLPALVAELNGQIKVLLVGKVDSGKNKGIRSTFEAVPDAPVSRFVLEMKGGKKYGLLENSENLCRASKAKRRAIVRFTGQNGKVDQYKPVVRNQCGKRGKRSKSHRRTSSRGRPNDAAHLPIGLRTVPVSRGLH
jgi:hypothetical protein